MNGDECIKCGVMAMPRLREGSIATARCCQGCGFVEELTPPPLRVVVVVEK